MGEGPEERDGGFDLDIPVVASRRAFFEQESVVADPVEKLESDLTPDQIAEKLRTMRETAADRTGSDPT